MTPRAQRTRPVQHHTPVRVRPTPTTEPDFPTPQGHQTTVHRRPSKPLKRTWVNALTNNTRNTLLSPATGYRVRLIRIWAVIKPAEVNSLNLELYFGTGANATTDRTKIIDLLRTGTTAGTIATRTFDALSVGRAPTGANNEVLSYRWDATPAIDHNHVILVEYIEELANRRK